MVLGLGIIESVMLTSHGIIASMLAMVLGRLARWDRNRQADMAASRPTPQERLLADFCENAAIGMCSVAPNGRILWANKAELHLLGFAPQDYIGHHITEFHADAASMSEVLTRLRAGELLHDYETRLRCRDGAVKHVLIDSNVHRRDGELVSTRFFTRDITERRQFEAQQRELYSRYESLIARSPAGIFETDAKGRCVFVNEKWCELSGLTRQQALGSGWKQAIHPEDRERELEAWQKNTRAGEELQINCRWMTPKGTITWVHGSVVPLRSTTGEITGFLGTISDISALKQAEAVIREARNQAETANRTKSEFLANMSHEMRTPLNGIIGMTELALDTAVDGEQRDCLQTVKESAESLLTIINELLDFAKVEAGKIILDRVDFSLGDWLRDSLKPLMFRSRQKGLDFRCLIDANIPKLLVGDPEWLRHILVNLVSNAVKFTDKGFVRCSVKLQSINKVEVPIWELDSVAGAPAGVVVPRTSVDRATLHFTVQDTGIGVPTDKHQAIFIPFEQADKSITRRYGGTGLGLAIARQLTELMHGNIWVESVISEGSTFHFTVQLGIADPAVKRVSQAELDKAQAQQSLPSAPVMPTRPLRVLVAEDNPVNQQLIVKFLKKQGHETAVAGDGNEAVEALEKDPTFDVILMDMQMPRMSGLEATAIIRRQEETTDRHIPIIALTASVLKGDRERCLASGMDDYLTKPVNRNELFAALGRLSISARPVPAVAVAIAVAVDADTIDLDERVPAPVVAKGQSAGARDPHCEETFIMPKSKSSLLSSAITWETTAPSVIDRKTLWKRLDGDRELLRELLEGYRGCCPEVVAELREGVTRQDSKLVQRAAHQLKGMVSSLAATQAFTTARDLERSGQASDFTQAPDILAKLEEALREVDAELECIVNQD
ncbi:MAG: Histidine kinase [Planctomycetaceae bacterium]|nr:Histidine kinase [Planctomycetaceae bacterium]